MYHRNIYQKTFIFVYFMLSLIEVGLCLECFVCHSKDDRDCSDPYQGNRTDLVDCQRVRDVGLGFIAASSALGAAPGPFSPLSQPPHVCFKITLGSHMVRGCGKPDLCENYTVPDCFTCDADGCNASTYPQPPVSFCIILLLLPLLVIM